MQPKNSINLLTRSKAAKVYPSVNWFLIKKIAKADYLICHHNQLRNVELLFKRHFDLRVELVGFKLLYTEWYRFDKGLYLDIDGYFDVGRIYELSNLLITGVIFDSGKSKRWYKHTFMNSVFMGSLEKL